MSEIFSVKTVARYLGFSPRKLYQLIKEDRIPYSRIGGQYRFIKEDIDTWLRGEKENLAGDKEGLEAALNRLKAIKDINKKRLYFVGLLTRLINKEGLRPVVVGGCALEFYTTGGYSTGDIDIIFSDNKLLDEKLSSLRFKRVGRHWISEELDLYLESPGSQLSQEEIKRLTTVNIENFKVYLIGPEDLILDRLKAYVHWRSEDDGFWAKELLFMYQDKLEMAYLKRKARREKVDKALAKILREVKKINE